MLRALFDADQAYERAACVRRGLVLLEAHARLEEEFVDNLDFAKSFLTDAALAHAQGLKLTKGIVKFAPARCNGLMDTEPSYRGYRFPAEIIAHCTWLYFRFCLSFRDVQEMMMERGVEVSHEAIRLWTLKFGARAQSCRNVTISNSRPNSG